MSENMEKIKEMTSQLEEAHKQELEDIRQQYQGLYVRYIIKYFHIITLCFYPFSFPVYRNLQSI